MPSHTFDSSNGADKAAKKAGRFFKGKVYNTKAQAEAARKAAASVGKGSGPTKARSDGRASGLKRTTEVVVVEDTFELKALEMKTICFKGPGANQKLLDLQSRDPKIMGVRAELSFPLNAAKTRWVIATAHQLSAGHKTTAQVSKVVGAQVFDNGDYVDKWLTIGGVSGAVNPLDDAGNSLLKVEDHRNGVFSLASTAVGGVTGGSLKWHITVQLNDTVSACVDL